MNAEPKLGMNGSVKGKELAEAEETIEATYWAWQRLASATTLPEQAGAIEALGNAVLDLATWHSSWDYERGVIWTEEDLEDHYLEANNQK